MCCPREKKTTLKEKKKHWKMVKIYFLMTNHCQKLQEKKGFTKRRLKKIVYKEVGEHSDSDQHHDSDKDPDYNI